MKKYLFFAFLCCALTFQNARSQNSGTLKIESVVCTPTSCQNTADGIATITISGGRPSYTFTVDYLAPTTQTGTTNQFRGLQEGDHQVRVTDADGNAVSGVFTIKRGFLVSAESKFVRCDEPVGGAITVRVLSEGVSNQFRYKLNRDDAWQPSPEFKGLAEKSYTVFVTDENGCEDKVENITIRKSNTAVTIKGNHVKCWGGFGSIITTVTPDKNDIDGKSDSIQYFQLFMNGAPFSDKIRFGDFNELSAGIYRLEAKDSNGCLHTLNTTLEEPEKRLSLIQKDVRLPQGGVKGSITVEPTGGWGGYHIVCSEFIAGVYQREIVWLTDVPAGDYTFGNLENFQYMFHIRDRGECIAANLLIDLSKPTGETEIEASVFQIFPNPSDDGRFVVEWNDAVDRTVTIEVFSISGQLMYKTKTLTGGRTAINMSNLSSGVYLLHIPELNITRKILIQ